MKGSIQVLHHLLGHNAISKPGEWQFLSHYRALEIVSQKSSHNHWNAADYNSINSLPVKII
jgi:hypothetical protein